MYGPIFDPKGLKDIVEEEKIHHDMIEQKRKEKLAREAEASKIPASMRAALMFSENIETD